MMLCWADRGHGPVVSLDLLPVLLSVVEAAIAMALSNERLGLPCTGPTTDYCHQSLSTLS